MDLLAEIVEDLELRSSVYFRAEFSAPFAVAVPEDRRRIRIHVAGPGRSCLWLPSGESVIYEEGDLVLVPHGSAHVLASKAAGAALPLDEMLATHPPQAGVLRYGGGGESIVLVCGHFAFDESIVHPLLESLPPLIHLRASAGVGYAWVPTLLEAAEREAHLAEPAGDAVARRLSEILFIQLLRAVLVSGAHPGLLSLVDEAGLGRALRSMHADPGADWSLDALASVAGASRSVFAERFREHVGVTPMRYLTDWRMRKARGLLADAALSVGDVGRRVGYASEAAFSRAFRESVGEPPGRHRRTLLRQRA